MKRLLLGLATTLAFFVASSYGIHRGYRVVGLARASPRHESGVPALLITAAAVTLAYARTNLRLYRSLRNFLAGKAPEDGEYVAIAGVIRTDAPVTTPLSGRPAAFFTYSIYKGVGRRGRREYYRGEALTPSVIVTPQGDYRLLALPAFGLSAELDRTEALVRFEAYLAVTPMDSPETAPSRPGRMTWSDDSGHWRADVMVRERDLADPRLGLSEEAVFDNQSVCVIGRYSGARGAIVPPENWLDETEVISGDGDTGLRYLLRLFLFQMSLGLLLVGGACIVVHAYVSRQWGW